MDIFLAQLLNALLYAAVLFLIAGGLSLIFGVMRIVNLAHGSLYALGAYVMAWGLGRLAGESGSEPIYLIALLPVAAVAVGATGAVLEPILLRPLYARAEEYQLLLTFGLLLILEDAMRYIWGPTPLTASPLWAAFGTLHLMGATYPRYNVVVILLGVLTAVLLWVFVFKTRFGVMLRATSQNRRMAAALGINVGGVYVQAFALGCLMAGLAGAVIVPIQGAVLGMGVDALVLAFVVVVIGGLGSLDGAPLIGWLASPFQRIQLTYGLVFGIAALAFNLLLGYTGLLSFGHAVFFGSAAYATGLLVKYLHVSSMEGFLLAGCVSSLVLAAGFGAVCVRYTRIFFSILTLALSQVVWALALKFFWITNGTDGLRIPTPTLLLGLVGVPDDKVRFLSFTYYYYVLAVFFICMVALGMIAASPFGKALQAIRDNEIRAQFVGIEVWRYRWSAFVVSGAFTGVAGTLFAPLNGLSMPVILHWPLHGQFVFMTVLGGFKSFSGPILGGVAYNYLETYVIKTTEYWQMLLGIILVALVLIMPQGIIGALSWLVHRRSGRR